MSLLMDALKKAEMAKRQGTAEPGREPFRLADDSSTPSLSSLSLETVESSPTVTSDANTLASTPDAEPSSTASQTSSSATPAAPVLSDIENFGLAQFASPSLREQAVAAERSRTGSNSPQDSAKAGIDQRNVQNVFRAKQADALGAGKKSPAFAIAVGATTIMATVAIGIYFWWQLQPRSGVGLTPSQATRVAPPPAPLPIPAGPASQPQAIGAPPSASVASATIQESRTTSVDESMAMPAESSLPNRTPRTPAASRAAIPAAEDERLIRVTTVPMRLNPVLAQAYEAARRGDWAGAQKSYAAVLDSDPHNTDALHALASIALRDNRLGDAERYLQKLLLANPQDASAAAALANVYGRSNPDQAEAKLRALMQAQPELAAAAIALGNLYSGQERWSEAQQAYFTAYANQPDNPDLLFNLAISLEYLNQPKLAVQYYKEALQASKRWPAMFSAAQVDERLRALQP